MFNLTELVNFVKEFFAFKFAFPLAAFLSGKLVNADSELEKAFWGVLLFFTLIGGLALMSKYNNGN
jgi:biotin transporter BioY